MANDIGQLIKQLRRSRGITQQQLADKLQNVTRCSISNYENGKRNISIIELRRLCQIFNVSLDYFGVTEADDVFELLNKIKLIFNNNELSAESKQEIFDEIMKIYLTIKK